MRVTNEDPLIGGPIMIDRSYDEQSIEALAYLLDEAARVLRYEEELLRARTELARRVAYLRSDRSATPFTQDLLRRLLGDLYPSEVEKVGEGPKVAQ